MSYLRTPEHRKKRAEMIRQWKPWEKSTGPKTKAGKAKVAQNAYKGGYRKMFREMSKVLREQSKAIDALRER